MIKFINFQFKIRLETIRNEEGVFTKERIDSLLNKKWHIYSIILNEIKDFDKINSTLRCLSDLPEKVKYYIL